MAHSSIANLPLEALELLETDSMAVSRLGKTHQISIVDAGFYNLMKERMRSALIVSGVDELLSMFQHPLEGMFLWEIQTGACFTYKNGQLCIWVVDGLNRWIPFVPEDNDFTDIFLFIPEKCQNLSLSRLESDLGTSNIFGFFLYNNKLGTLYYKNRQGEIFAVSVGENPLDIDTTVTSYNYYSFAQLNPAIGYHGFFGDVAQFAGWNGEVKGSAESTLPWDSGYTQMRIAPCPVVENGLLSNVCITVGQGAIAGSRGAGAVYVRIELYKALATTRQLLGTFDLPLESAKIGDYWTIDERIDGLQTSLLDVSHLNINLNLGELIGVQFITGSHITDLTSAEKERYLISMNEARVTLTTKSQTEVEYTIDEGMGVETHNNSWGCIDEAYLDSDLIDENF